MCVQYLHIIWQICSVLLYMCSYILHRIQASPIQLCIPSSLATVDQQNNAFEYVHSMTVCSHNSNIVLLTIVTPVIPINLPVCHCLLHYLRMQLNAFGFCCCCCCHCITAGYNTSPSQRYPVLYMHDGQNCIDPKSCFTTSDWGVDECMDRLLKAGKTSEFISVLIWNTPQRSREYMPAEALNWLMQQEQCWYERCAAVRPCHMLYCL